MRQVNRDGRLGARGRVVAWLALLLLGTVTAARTQTPEPPADPWVETRAPGVFGDARASASEEWTVAYRVDATVRLPLLITAIPIASRQNVGVTTFSARDFITTDRRTGVRAYEFFAASFPARARGLNRLGFLREAVIVGRTGIIETAQFGVISSEREDTMAEVEQVLDNDAELLPYSVIDSLITTDAADSRVLQLLMSGEWETAASLYDEVRPRWDGDNPTYTRHLRNDDRTGYETPLAFFSGLQVSMQKVANAVAAGEDPRRTQRYQPYVHNGRPLRFELRKVARDGDRTAEFARAGWLENPAALRRLEYRLRDARGKEVDRLKLWVELRASSPDDRFPPPHLPVAYEYEPGSYLRLRAVRVTESAATAVQGR